MLKIVTYGNTTLWTVIGVSGGCTISMRLSMSRFVEYLNCMYFM